MDLFNKKRVRELEELCRAFEVQNRELRKTLRDMDQVIFSMSQHVDWNGKQPYFAKLCDAMMARKEAESSRIGRLIETELNAMEIRP